jgi:cobalt-zinc-cadmium efflux system protein
MQARSEPGQAQRAEAVGARGGDPHLADACAQDHGHAQGRELKHDHDHDHFAEHATDPKRIGRLRTAFLLTSTTMLAEAVGGVVSGSLALLADAAHMLVDAAALLFAWLGARFAQRPADARRSFGYARLEVLVGYSNALLQIGLVLWIAVESVQRLLDPQPILSGTMLAVAVLGLVVNLFVLRTLGGHHHDDLNSAGAYLHVLGDLLGSVAAISAALLVRYLDWTWSDAVVSLLVAGLILRAALRLLWRAGHILLEGVPEGLEIDHVAPHLERTVPAVRAVHHVHIWQLAGGYRLATLHAVLQPGFEADAAIVAVGLELKQAFAVDHATVQLDGVMCSGAGCGPSP